MSTELSQGVQESLLCLLCFDDGPTGSKAVRALVESKMFDPFYREIAEKAEQYLDKYKRAPGEHTYDIIEQLKAKKPDLKDGFDRLFSSIQQTKDVVNNEYVLAHATRFARFQRMRAGLTKALDALESDRETNVDEAESALTACLKGSYELFKPGLLMNDVSQALSFLHQEDEYFETGIPQLDKYNLGPMRRGLHLFMALPNRGKSHWGVMLGRESLKRRRTVLHITLEMAEHKVAQRYVQSFLAVSKRSERIKRATFNQDENGRFIDFSEMDVGVRPSLQDKNIEKTLRVKVARVFKSRPKLLIKQFPTGQLTMSQLTAYLDNLEGSLGFIPDLIILDYADLMKTEAKHRREAIGVIYQELRGLAVERNIAMVTMTQSNRAGLTSKTLNEGNTSEDFSKVHTADTIIAYSQTDEEYALGLARLVVTKARDDQARARILISQQYSICQFCLESARLKGEASYWKSVETEDEADE